MNWLKNAYLVNFVFLKKCLISELKIFEKWRENIANFYIHSIFLVIFNRFFGTVSLSPWNFAWWRDDISYECRSVRQIFLAGRYVLAIQQRTSLPSRIILEIFEGNSFAPKNKKGCGPLLQHSFFCTVGVLQSKGLHFWRKNIVL